MRLALFDLDHTLIPFDSGQAWLRFLIRTGRLEAAFDARYLDYCHQYVAGTLVIDDLLRLNLGVLARHGPGELADWRTAHRAEQAPQVPLAAHGLVQAHRARGDLCVMATATPRFVAEVYADLLGVDALVASEGAQRAGTGRYTGEPLGPPCYGEGKRQRVLDWLQARGTPLDGFTAVHFYSDSMNDLPLLAQVSDPVVVTPDARLATHAARQGWPIATTLDDALALMDARSASDTSTPTTRRLS